MSYRLGHILKPLRHTTGGRVAMIYIIAIIFIALFADFLSGDIPIYAGNKERFGSPLMQYYAGKIRHGSSLNYQWRDKFPNATTVVYPLNPYGPGELDRSSTNYAPPGAPGNKSSVHVLGTDDLGRDVLAALIHGSRVVLLVSFLAVFLAVAFGVLIGVFPGFYGDDKISIRWTDGLLWSLFAVFFAYYAYYFGHHGWQPLVLLCTMVLAVQFALNALYQRLKRAFYSVHVPLDLIVMRLIDVLRSIPGLFFLLTLLAVINKPGIWSLIFVIAFLRWSSFTRYVRGELLSLRESIYVQQFLMQGLSDLKIMFRHLLPSALTPIYVLIAFSMGSAVILESTLSFLGIGLPPDYVSWGMLMNAARNNIEAWWMILFPSLLILATVIAFNALARSVSAYYRTDVAFTD